MIPRAITYQGRLLNDNVPADGIYDLQFALYDAATGGMEVGSAVNVEDVDVVEGYFTVDLDFGENAFNGDPRWLQISVRPGDSSWTYNLLQPRQRVAPTPYALQVLNGSGAGGGDSDWTTSGSNIYRLSGNVGIGTSSPSTDLDVDGRIRIRGGSPGVGKILTSDATGLASWKTPTGGTGGSGDDLGSHVATQNISLNGNWLSGDGGDEGVYVDTDGRIGVGTKSPHWARLEVRSSSEVPILGKWEGVGDVAGVQGMSTGGIGVRGSSEDFCGVYGDCSSFTSTIAVGVIGYSWRGTGVFGDCPDGQGVYGRSSNGYAGYFEGESYFSGFVGIGTESPSEQLEVMGANPRILVNADSGNPELNLEAPGQSRWAMYQDESSGDLSFYQKGDKVTFQDGTGNVGIGTSSPSYRLDVSGTIRGNNVSPSDARLKTQIKTIDNALERVILLRGTQFKWIEDKEQEGLQIGVIAQEVEAVFPEVVSSDTEGYKSVNYGKLVAPLIEAVKRLKKQQDVDVGMLQKENAALKEELAATRERLARFATDHADMQNRLRAIEAVVSRLAGNMNGGLQ